MSDPIEIRGIWMMLVLFVFAFGALDLSIIAFLAARWIVREARAALSPEAES